MPTLPRTSHSDPLRIATIAIPGSSGRIGLTFCPGKKDLHAVTGAWDRDLALDVGVIKTWGACAVVCLMETKELAQLEIKGLPQVIKRAGLRWFHLPIKDASVPDAAFEATWRTAGSELRTLLKDGKYVLVHCKGGLGRSGLIAARLLVELGLSPDQAIARVRRARPGAIETPAQEAHVHAVRPITNRTTSAVSDLEDRALGCFVGLAIGDALGATLEFKARDTYPPLTDMIGGGPFDLAPGQWTDDTAMALCLAESLLACGTLDPTDLMERFRRWRDEGHNSVTGTCFDIGVTINAAITRFIRTGDPLAGSSDPNSAGNGSIMRLAPVPIFFRNNIEAAVDAAVLQSRTTHAAPECLESAELMARILVALLNRASWQAALAVPATLFSEPKVRALAAGKWRKKSRAQIRSSGYVIDTLEAALWAVDRAGDFNEAVLTAVNLGHDADTVGAVAGQLAGARFGVQQIPLDWRNRLAWSSPLKHLAQQMIDTKSSDS